MALPLGGLITIHGRFALDPYAILAQDDKSGASLRAWMRGNPVCQGWLMSAFCKAYIHKPLLKVAALVLYTIYQTYHLLT
ncbi:MULTISPECIES: hypothetical protein [Cysteiniphilum]|uniref:hypothetical protein n=1 Tax=Cysteiniphilum TaxID=2056696 RepID=UPI0019395322|nr:MULTISPECIES: hypothetical protein [Cysteiniphilum]